MLDFARLKVVEYKTGGNKLTTKNLNTNKTPNFNSLNEEMEVRTKEYVEGLIAGRKINNALNNKSVQATLTSANEWSEKHHGKVINLDDV